MKKCGLKNIKIGKQNVKTEDVIAALKSGRKAKGIEEQLAKSYVALPDGVEYLEWEKWFMNQKEGIEGRGVSMRDIVRGQEYSKEDKAQAQQLIDMLETNQNRMTPEGRRTLNSIRKAIKDNVAGLTPKQVDSIMSDVARVIQREDDVKIIKRFKRKAKKNLSSKVGRDLPPSTEKLLLIKASTLTPAQFIEYMNIMRVLGAAEAELSIPKGFQTKINNFAAGLAEHNLKEQKEKSSSSAVDDSKKQKEAEAYKAQILSRKIAREHLTDRDSRDIVTLLNSLKQADLDLLDLSELRNLAKATSNINNGYGISHITFNTKTKIQSNRALQGIAAAVKSAKSSLVLDAYQRNMGKILTIGKAAAERNWVYEVFRSNPLSNIDQLIGSKGRDIVEGIFNKLGIPFEGFTTYHKGLAEEASAAEEALINESLGNRKDIVRSKFKVSILQLTREYESNIGKEGIHNPHEDILSTIEDSKYYGPEEKKILQELVDEFSKNGRFDQQALTDSLTKSEKKVLEITDNMYRNSEPMAQFAVRVIHGESSPMYENYVFRHRDDPEAAKPSEEAFLQGNIKNQLIGSKSGSVYARDNSRGPLKLDPIDNAYRSTKNIALDYYMTPAIREVRQTTKSLTEQFKNDTSHQGLVADAIEKAADEALKNVFNASTIIPSVTDKVLSVIVKNGYRMVLSSVPRAIAETGTNLIFVATTAPREFALGATEYFGLSTDSSSIDILLNSGSTMASKLFDKQQLSGKFAEGDILSGDDVRTKDRVGDYRISYIMNRIYKLSGAKITHQVASKLADGLISSPDKMIGRPLWLGVMATQFKKLTGKDINFEKIKANDEAYMNKFSEEISQARARADEYATFAGAATNPFTTVLKLQTTEANKASIGGVIKTINSYMARFMFFEQATFMKGLNAMVGRSYLTPAQGASLMTATILRMGLYNASRLAMISMMFGKSEDDEPFEDRVVRDMIGSFSSLLINRNLVTIPKLFTNYGIEHVNREYLDFLRDGEKYDPFKHSIVFSQLGERDFGYGKSGTDFVANKLSGKYSPAIKGANKAWAIAGKIQSAKTKSARDRAINEFLKHVSIETAALTGMLPLYRDVMTYVKRNMK